MLDRLLVKRLRLRSLVVGDLILKLEIRAGSRNGPEARALEVVNRFRNRLELDLEVERPRLAERVFEGRRLGRNFRQTFDNFSFVPEARIGRTVKPGRLRSRFQIVRVFFDQEMRGFQV